MATPSSSPHVWYTPADCSAMLLGMRHGDHYRAPCPLHPGNPTSLSIREGKDRHGHPCTLMKCFAHDCAIEDICAAMGIELRNLFCVHPDYARANRHVPRAHSPRIDRLKTMEEPTPDEIAAILLEEMIVSDPAWIQECAPARQKMWELAQQSPRNRECFTQALRQVRINALRFWDTLAREQEGASDGANRTTV